MGRARPWWAVVGAGGGGEAANADHAQPWVSSKKRHIPNLFLNGFQAKRDIFLNSSRVRDSCSFAAFDEHKSPPLLSGAIRGQSNDLPQGPLI